MTQESFKQLRDDIKGIGIGLNELFSQKKSAYETLKNLYPDVKNSGIEEIIKSAESIWRNVSEDKINLLMDINNYVSKVTELAQEISSIEEETKMYSGEPGKLRFIITDQNYLKSGDKGEKASLDVQLEHETDFQVKIEPYLKDMILRSSVFNALGDYLEENYGTRDLDAVLAKNNDTRLPTVKYENRLVVKFVVKKVEDDESKKFFKQKLALKRLDLVMDAYKDHRGELNETYPGINDSVGLGFGMAIEKLRSELTGLELKSTGKDLKAEERKELFGRMDEIRTEISEKVDKLLEQYPKLKGFMNE